MLNPTLAHKRVHPVQKSFQYLYTSPEDAVQELKLRRKDMALTAKVHAALGDISAPLFDRTSELTALLFRQIATPSHEMQRFLELADASSLKPLILEYSKDKFVGAGNAYKRALGKMPIFQYTGSDGRDMVRNQTVIDFNAFMGKPLADVCCISGKTLSEFHHQLFQLVLKKNPEKICYDASDWFQAKGNTASRYYDPLMTLLIRDCILFDNFHMTPQEMPFVEEIVVPAFNEVASRYGLRPLIVQLVPPHQELRAYWDMYPKVTSEHLFG